MNPVLTAALPGDLPDIAAIHVQSWKETYTGLVPQEYLDGLDAKLWLPKWEEGYKFVERGKHALFIAHVADEPVGFVSLGPVREDGYKHYGEIYAIYVLKAFCGQGIGHKLFIMSTDWFKSKQFTQAYIWVLDTNLNAIRSYEKWGARIDKDHFKHGEIAGQPIIEMQAVFDNI